MPGDASRAAENFAPIPMECDAPHLTVLGELPRGLNGTLFRNGPNPQFPSPHGHWFMGDGMVHAFCLQDGRASYRNRWVRTDKWRAENAAGRSLGAGFGPRREGANIANTGVANTNIVWHAGKLLALEEAHLPFELDPATLATRGVQDFAGALAGPFTAHPKTDPATGDLVFFGYSADGPLTPGMTFGTIGADGRVRGVERFQAPYCAMVHDFAVTARHVLFPVMPLAGSLARAMAGKMPFAWEPSLGGHIGLLRRDAGVASLRWFRAEASFAYHVLNAWDAADGRIHADVMEYAAPPFFPRADGAPVPEADTEARLVRWTLDPAAGTDAFSRTPLDDFRGEFPRLDERFAGLENRFGAFAASSAETFGLDTIVWRDMQRGVRRLYTLPAGDAVSEPVFVPRDARAAEGDGWLLCVVWRGEARRSDLVVLDTSDVAAGPVATVPLAHRVPFGFHGNWMPPAA
jgi:carotenoid cleavage dioxygenase